MFNGKKLGTPTREGKRGAHIDNDKRGRGQVPAGSNDEDVFEATGTHPHRRYQLGPGKGLPRASDLALLQQQTQSLKTKKKCCSTCIVLKSKPHSVLIAWRSGRRNISKKFCSSRRKIQSPILQQKEITFSRCSIDR